jgi:hypothetical protein
MVWVLEQECTPWCADVVCCIEMARVYLMVAELQVVVCCLLLLLKAWDVV